MHARQRTLRDTLRWSYDLLPAPEQRLFARLGVFAGGWSAHAAAIVCDDDRLAPLAEQNLIRVDGERFSMLETIRELALEELAAAGEEHESAPAHVAWCLGVGGGRRPEPGRRRSCHVARERGRRAREPARRARLGRVGRRRRGAGAADRRGPAAVLDHTRPPWRGPRVPRRVARALPPSPPSAARERSPPPAGSPASRRDLGRDEPAALESLALLPAGEDWHRAVCLNLLGTMARLDGRLAEARKRYEEALAVAAERDLWWPTALAWANLGTLAELEGRHREALESHERSVAIAQAGGDRWMTATCMVYLGRAARHAGEVERAIALHGEALRAFARLDNVWGVAVCIDGFACLAADRGDFLGAARLFGAEQAVRERAGVSPWRTIQAEHDAGVRAASAALGEAAWAGAHAQGAALTEPEAIADALAFAAAEG